MGPLVTENFGAPRKYFVGEFVHGFPDNISSCTAPVSASNEAEKFGQKVSASVKAETNAQNIKYEIKFRLIEGAKNTQYIDSGSMVPEREIFFHP